MDSGRRIEEIINIVKTTISDNMMLDGARHLVVGFSGGPDSMCLLDMLITLSDDFDLEIHPVHVNHGLRKPFCDEEAAICKVFCEERNLTMHLFQYDCEKVADEMNMSTEEAGRFLRYSAFKEVANRFSDAVICTAQNYNDQVETVLMRILRGTGISGLSGIPYIRDDEDGNRIVRPLLDLKREDIEEYLSLKGLSPNIDKTNLEPLYTRNKVRLELIPYLKDNYNPAVDEAIVRLAKSAYEDDRYLNEASEKAFDSLVEEGDENRVILNRGELLKIPTVIGRRVIKLALQSIGLYENVGSEHYNGVYRVLESESPSASMDLPGGYKMNNLYDKVEFIRLGSDPVGDSTCPIEVNILSAKEYETIALKDKSYAAFDHKKMIEKYGDGILDRISIRSRLAGDTINLKVGTKKIQDLMVDLKIPKSERDKVRVAAIGSEVLWFVPTQKNYMRWAHDICLDSDTEEVVLLKCHS